MNVLELTPQQLRHAADIQERILALQRELSLIVGSSGVAGITPQPHPFGTRKLSAAGRAAISRAAKARWARERALAAAGKPIKRHVSAAARRKMAEAARARWARARGTA